MEQSWPALIRRFSQLDVLVIGDAMLDTYLEGPAGRLCREAPVPIVSVRRRTDAPGGAANTALNVRRLGARVHLIADTGDDEEGARLRRALEQLGVPTDWMLVRKGRATLAKQRVLAGSQLLVRFDQGGYESLDAVSEESVINMLETLFPNCDAVIVSDYGYGVLTSKVLDSLHSLQLSHPRTVVVDSKDLDRFGELGVTAVKPNYEEACDLLGLATSLAGDRVQALMASGDAILERTGARLAAVTLDTEGALVFERGHPPYRTYAQPCANTTAAGAGDTFVSALALALASGADTPAAADLASAAAAVVVGKDGTVACSAEELLARVSATKLVEDEECLRARVEVYRRAGRRIVFANGCFDILHRGHITFLNRAKALGDVLIVGLNSDASVRRVKGPHRPINCLADRVDVLAALGCVDDVAVFDEDSPRALLRLIQPDVFAKGGDYTVEMISEAPLVRELGGEVAIVPYVEDRSTTGTIERIREAYLPPAAQPAPGISP